MKYLKTFENYNQDKVSELILCEYPEIKENTSKQPLLLIPGGGGNPV